MSVVDAPGSDYVSGGCGTGGDSSGAPPPPVCHLQHTDSEDTDRDSGPAVSSSTSPHPPHPNLLHATATATATSITNGKSAGGSYTSEEEEEEGSEEQFESYGENDDETDSLPSSTAFAPHSPVAPPLPPQPRNDNHHYSPSGRRVSSNALASQLYHHNVGASDAPSTNSDDMFAEEIAEDVYDLNSKVYQLQEQVAMLAQSQLSNNDKQIKLKQDNAALTERVHMLEEQIRDGELRAEKRVDEEQRRAQDLLSRMDKEKSLEIESLHYQLRDVENQYRSYKEETPRLKQQVEKLKQEKSEAQERLSDYDFHVKHMEEDGRTLQDKCRALQHELDVTNRTHGELLDELSKQLEELKRFKCEHENFRSRTPSLLEYPGRLQDMERQLHDLRQENSTLKEQHDELQAQMLNYSIQEGTKLLHTNPGVSLADELNDMSRDDVMEKLREQQGINKQLKQYIDDMLINIIDSNPGILEIKK